MSLRPDWRRVVIDALVCPRCRKGAGVSDSDYARMRRAVLRPAEYLYQRTHESHHAMRWPLAWRSASSIVDALSRVASDEVRHRGGQRYGVRSAETRVTLEVTRWRGIDESVDGKGHGRTTRALRGTPDDPEDDYQAQAVMDSLRPDYVIRGDSPATSALRETFLEGLDPDERQEFLREHRRDNMQRPEWRGRSRVNIDQPWVRKAELGDEWAVTRDFLRAGGWHVRKDGATGNPIGRPVTGMKGDYLREQLEADTGFAIEKLGLAFGRKHDRGIREVLAVWIAVNSVNHEHLGALLGKKRNTIWSLGKEGERLLEQKSPNKGRRNDESARRAA